VTSTSGLMRALPVRLRLGLLAALALCLFAGPARTGTAIFFCDAMQEVRAEPCCRRAVAESAQIESVDCSCCHMWLARAVPPYILEGAPVDLSLPAPHVATLGVEEAVRNDSSAWKARPDPSEGIPPPHLERRVVLLI